MTRFLMLGFQKTINGWWMIGVHFHYPHIPIGLVAPCLVLTAAEAARWWCGLSWQPCGGAPRLRRIPAGHVGLGDLRRRLQGCAISGRHPNQTLPTDLAICLP